MTKSLSEEEVVNIICRVKESGSKYLYDYKKHKIVVMDNTGEEAVQLRLPITLPSPDIREDEDYEPVNYIILLIQSGSSALAYCEGGDMVDHKVFKSYMVRKKQGKSQIKYLKTKGKSKAGSRVRLGNALSFFEDINERLHEYFEENTINRIALSCSKTLIPFLFSSKVEPPFDKKDERIFKIPKHIHEPNYEVLLETYTFLQKGELIFSEDYKGFADKFL
ncbi:MAG: hypothetical protein ACNS60_13595 [Candidatus Cyclobacteriaceae bacterium M2_1C_046]